MGAQTGIVKDYRYLSHDPGSFHPESPKRLEAIYNMLEARDMRDHFVHIEGRSAVTGEIALNHSRAYIDMVARTAGKGHCSLDFDTQTSAESYQAAMLAAGSLCDAVDCVMAGKVGNAFALVRPPGHHAEFDGAAGFCIFNNIAIGARYALKMPGIKRILIVDWDLHHGNGTQRSFYADQRVLYFSAHQYPFYPGTGSLQENGVREGLGYTVNVPLGRGQGDAEYTRIFKKVLEPLALAFRPDLVMVSAGFDIHLRDPLGGMKVTPAGFAKLTRILMNIADRCCGGKLVMTLEGGYNIEGQAQSVRAVLKEMNGETIVPDGELAVTEDGADRSIDRVIGKVIDQIKPIWQVY